MLEDKHILKNAAEQRLKLP